MRRRELLSGSFALLLFARARAAAEPARTWRVAYVGSGSALRTVPVLRDALRGLGYEDGKNLILDVREARATTVSCPILSGKLLAQNLTLLSPRPPLL